MTVTDFVLSPRRPPGDRKIGNCHRLFAADLQRAERLVPGSVRSIRLGLAPDLQKEEVLDADLALPQALEEMLTKRWWKIRPLNLRHHHRRSCAQALPSHASAPPDRGFRPGAPRSSKNRLRSCSLASRPDSMSSTRTRLALLRLVFARARTRRATPGGRLTLWRTAFSLVGSAQYTPLCTTLHHHEPLRDGPGPTSARPPPALRPRSA